MKSGCVVPAWCAITHERRGPYSGGLLFQHGRSTSLAQPQKGLVSPRVSYRDEALLRHRPIDMLRRVETDAAEFSGSVIAGAFREKGVGGLIKGDVEDPRQDPDRRSYGEMFGGNGPSRSVQVTRVTLWPVRLDDTSSGRFEMLVRK